MKPKLKPPGSKLLKLKFDKPLSDFAFKFNLRRYNTGVLDTVSKQFSTIAIEGAKEGGWTHSYIGAAVVNNAVYFGPFYGSNVGKLT